MFVLNSSYQHGNNSQIVTLTSKDIEGLTIIEPKFNFTAHCYLSIDAMAQPMQVKEDIAPYGGKQP